MRILFEKRSTDYQRETKHKLSKHTPGGFPVDVQTDLHATEFPERCGHAEMNLRKKLTQKGTA